MEKKKKTCTKKQVRRKNEIHSQTVKNDYKYSEEGVSLCSGIFRKALEMRVASEWSFRIPVVSESVKMGEEDSAHAQREEAGKEKRERSARRHAGK